MACPEVVFAVPYVIYVCMQVTRHNLPKTVPALDALGCRHHVTSCGRLRWKQLQGAGVRGVPREGVYFHWTCKNRSFPDGGPLGKYTGKLVGLGSSFQSIECTVVDGVV